MAVEKLEVCISNLKLGSKYVFDLVSQTYPSIKVKRWGCLGYCHRCIHRPFVLIDDHEFIEAEDKEELWRKVRAYIEEQA